MKNGITGVSVSYSLVLALMLYQTGDSSGTFGAFFSMALVAFFLLVSKKRRPFFSSSKEGQVLLFTATYLFLTQLLLGVAWLSLNKILSEILLCALLFSYTFSEKEQRFTRFVFEASMIFYSLLIIRASRDLIYVHQRVELFGTTLDPNFVGIPLIPAIALLLDDIIRFKILFNKLLYALGLFVVVGAVLSSGSRGSLVGLIIVVLFVLFSFVKDSHNNYRYLTGIGVAVAVGLLFYDLYFDTISESITRMSDFGEGADNNRYFLWRSSFEIFKENFLLGGGYGIVAKRYGHASHNTYIELLCETGIIGFGALVYFYWKMLRRAMTYNFIFEGIVLAMFSQMFFLDTLNNRCVWALLGWVAMLPLVEQSKGFNNKD